MLELLALLMQQCLFFLGYITGRSEFPPALNRAEEAELIGKLDAGDHNARQELITHNLRLVSHIARKYQIPGYGADDLISIGVIGLIKAVDSFKSASGTPLGTYAARCIENEILMYFRGQRKSAGDVSLSELIETGKDGTALSLMDVICADDDLFEQMADKEIYARLYQTIDACLDPRERDVIILRYGLGNREPLAQREIAALCGISRSYVSRIEKKALQKLEKALAQ